MLLMLTLLAGMVPHMIFGKMVGGPGDDVFCIGATCNALNDAAMACRVDKDCPPTWTYTGEFGPYSTCCPPVAGQGFIYHSDKKNNKYRCGCKKPAPLENRTFVVRGGPGDDEVCDFGKCRGPGPDGIPCVLDHNCPRGWSYTGQLGAHKTCCPGVEGQGFVYMRLESNESFRCYCRKQEEEQEIDDLHEEL